ncbi:MAG: tetratricopeptide repeat protein [Halioglobus sp.]
MKIYYNSLAIALVSIALTGNALAHSVSSEASSAHSNTTLESETSTMEQLLERYSLQGDDRLLDMAEQKLARDQRDTSPEQLLQKAWLAQAAHRFEQSQEILERLLAAQPGYGQAWLLNAAVSSVSGQTEKARNACGRVVLSVSPTAGTICFATLAATTEEKTAAYKGLERLPQATEHSRLNAWRWSVHGQLAQDLGMTEQAEQLYRQSLHSFPAVQTRTALTDLLIWQGRYQEALTLTSGLQQVPAIAVRQLVARKQMGHNIHQDVETMDRQFQRWFNEKDFRHAREMTLFYLDIKNQPKMAFRCAQMNAKMQREAQDISLLERATENLHGRSAKRT